MQFRISADELRKNERWLRRLALDLTRDADVARDLVQDTLLVAIRKPPPAGSAVRPWLAAVLRNTFRMWLRTHGRRERREAHADEPPAAPSPERALDAAWASEALLQEIERLSEPYRTTVLLRYYDGLRASEIAERLGVPAATVRKRHQLALAELRRRLDRRTDGDRDAWKGPLVRAFGVGGLGARRAHAPTLAFAASGALLVAVGFGVVPRVRLASQAAARPARGALLNARAHASTLAPDRHALPLMTADESAAAPTAREGCRPLRELVEAAEPDAIIHVPACIYREHLVVLKPVSLVAAPGAEIRGSDVWPGATFARAGDLWTSSASVPAFVDWHRDCEHHGGRCHGPEQVFRDGQALVRVGRGTRPGAGEFALDDARHVVLGDDPTGHVVEVTVRPSWISVVASNVTVRGFRMRHAAGHEHTFSVVSPARGARIQHNVLSDAWTYAMTIAGDEHVVEHNEIFASGGLRVEPGHGTIVRHNRVHDCELATVAKRSWRSAALSTILADALTLEANEVWGNHGIGIHVIGGSGARVIGNVVRNNDNAGIAIQNATDATIARNRLWSNGYRAMPVEPAVFVVSSRRIEVGDNAIAFHPFAMYVGPMRAAALPTGFDTCQDTSEVRVHDNFVVAAPPAGGIVASGDPREAAEIAPCASNRIERNAVAGLRAPATNDVALTPAEAAQRLAAAGIPGR